MKIIINPSSSNVTDSVRLHPDRLYFCQPCELNIPRQQVRKDAEGKYHCPRCYRLVTDITDTRAGRDLKTILGL